MYLFSIESIDIEANNNCKIVLLLIYYTIQLRKLSMTLSSWIESHFIRSISKPSSAL